MHHKKVFVTGGMGLIGSHLVERLLNDDNEVIVGMRSRDPKAYFFEKNLDQKAIMANYDLKDFRRVLDIITKYEVDTIFHLGAQPIVTTAYVNPYETLSSNIVGTMNVLEAARLVGSVEAIVVASSDKAYGIAETLPYTETMKLNGAHPYDCSKSCTDLVSKMYAETYALPVTISRFGNIFGPGDLNFNRIIPGIMKSLLSGEELLLRSDGEMIRDYLYVKDVVEGYMLLADNISKTKGEAFNFGTDNQYSVLDVIRLCEKALHKRVNYTVQNSAKGEIPHQYLDSSKLRKLLGWQCNTDISVAIQETFLWYQTSINSLENASRKHMSDLRTAPVESQLEKKHT